MRDFSSETVRFRPVAVVLVSALSLCAARPAAAASAPPPLARSAATGEVTIPTSEYRALKDAAERTKKARESADDGQAWVEPAEFVVTVEGETARFTESFRVGSDSRDWARVPLSAAEGFEAVTLQPEKSASVLGTAEGGSVILVRGAGSWTGRLERTESSTIDPEGRRIFEITLPLFPVQRGRIEIPGAELDVTIENGDVLARRVTGGRTIVEVAAKSGAALTVSIREKTGKERRSVAALKTSALLVARSTIVGADLVTDVSIRITATSGKIPGLEVTAPAGWKILSLRGAGLLASELKETRAGAARVNPSAEPLEAELRLVRTLSDDERIELPIPTVVVTGATDLYADFRAPEGAVAEAVDLGGFEAVGPERIPGDLAARFADSEEVLHLRRKEGAAKPPAYRLHRIAAARVLTAQVRSLRGETAISRTGKALTRLELEVVASAKPFLTLHLPPGAKFWGAESMGRPIVPAAPEGERIAIPLRAGRGRLARLSVTLLSDVPLPSGKGRLGLPVPWCDVPTSSVQWTVALPAGSKWKVDPKDTVWHEGYAGGGAGVAPPPDVEPPDPSPIAAGAREALAAERQEGARSPIVPRIPRVPASVVVHADLPETPFPPIRVDAEPIERKEDWQ